MVSGREAASGRPLASWSPTAATLTFAPLTAPPTRCHPAPATHLRCRHLGRGLALAQARASANTVQALSTARRPRPHRPRAAAGVAGQVHQCRHGPAGLHAADFGGGLSDWGLHCVALRQWRQASSSGAYWHRRGRNHRNVARATGGGGDGDGGGGRRLAQAAHAQRGAQLRGALDLRWGEGMRRGTQAGWRRAATGRSTSASTPLRPAEGSLSQPRPASPSPMRHPSPPASRRRDSPPSRRRHRLAPWLRQPRPRPRPRPGRRAQRRWRRAGQRYPGGRAGGRGSAGV